MHLNDHIRIYDDFINEEQLKDLMDFAVKQEYSKGRVVTLDHQEVEDKSTRIVEGVGLSPTDNSMTNVFWFHIIRKLIHTKYKEYSKNYNIDYLNLNGILPPEILKYTPGGHYRPHVDHCQTYPRTLSAVVFLNEDYTGGELVFPEHNGPKIYFKVEKKPGRCVIFPSNFLYPHAVTPVKTGVRYAIVTWMY